MSPDPEATPEDRLEGELFWQFDVYKDQMQGLRDIIAAAEPYASVLDDPDARYAGTRESMREVPASILPEIEDLLSKVAHGDLNQREFFSEILTRYSDELWSSRLVVRFHEMTMRQPRLPMLRNSILTAAVGAFESTTAAVVSAFFHCRPEALETNAKDREKEFSLKDLAQFSSIEDAVDSSISRRVESMMFGSLGDWRKFFVDAMKIDLSTLAINWPALQEIFQRRHVIVHNGGRASRRYLAQTKPLATSESIEEGQRLDCSQEYLEYAIDQLLVAGILLIISVAEKFSPKNQAGFVNISSLAYSLLKEGRWEAVKRLCRFGMETPVDQDRTLVFKVNMALAIKATDGLDGVSDEIKSWDVTALSDRFKLAKASLLENLEEAFEILTRLSERDEISTEDLLEWPLLSRMRNDRRFAVLISPRLADPAALRLLGPEFIILNPRSGVIHKRGCRFAKSGELVNSEASEVRDARHCKECWK